MPKDGHASDLMRAVEDLKLLLDGRLPDDYQHVERYGAHAAAMEQLILVHLTADPGQEAKLVRKAWDTVTHMAKASLTPVGNSADSRGPTG